MKHAFIDAQRSGHAVRTLCKALQVSASGYYAARRRPPSARAVRQSALATKIREVHRTSRQTYGAPRVHAELSALGVACCRNTVAKLMRIAVSDDGPGVPSGICERVFDRFFRAGASDNGAGLGLSLVQRVAELHAGSVMVDRAPLGGARFTVSFSV